MSKEHGQERRHFHRVSFTGVAYVLLDTPEEIAVELVDLSLQGGLVRMPHPVPQTRLGEQGWLRVPLTEDLDIQLKVQLQRINGRDLGLRITSMELDSAQHLKRLVELNLGDHTLLERDLAALYEVHST
ncbi:PilZ domain-containing protein [Ectothiorhodospira magna]|uniref:Cyclic diguanosine monophosphate-binding protein n=1 Tax=Ectothiorhodospira magna TaxID=867345 RepID=A0A1H8YWQ4_9GAMM|nr:PilZ domain-containing protein [Ectothiorhodospira magna]SEP56503.1 PilZ domain-containing protein [Ectothiorhodospira magna]